MNVLHVFHERPRFQLLDASGPWLCYWMVHAINLLGVEISTSLKHEFVKFVKRCENPDGGYGGGFMQTSHLATTFGAVNCLLSLGTYFLFRERERERGFAQFWLFFLFN